MKEAEKKRLAAGLCAYYPRTAKATALAWTAELDPFEFADAAEALRQLARESDEITLARWISVTRSRTRTRQMIEATADPSRALPAPSEEGVRAARARAGEMARRVLASLQGRKDDE